MVVTDELRGRLGRDESRRALAFFLFSAGRTWAEVSSGTGWRVSMWRDSSKNASARAGVTPMLCSFGQEAKAKGDPMKTRVLKPPDHPSQAGQPYTVLSTSLFAFFMAGTGRHTSSKSSKYLMTGTRSVGK